MQRFPIFQLVVRPYSSVTVEAGKILKGEVMVGIAFAFLVAGARSFLMSQCFYLQLKEGKAGSSSAHQSMKSLRESGDFS